MHSAKALGRLHTLEAPHRLDPLFDASMVLLQMVVQVEVGAMAHLFSERGFDGTGTGVVSVTGDPLRDPTGDGARGPEKSFRRCLVPLLAQQDIDQIPIAIYGTVEIRP